MTVSPHHKKGCIGFVCWDTNPTPEARALQNALHDRGIRADTEFYDGHKHIDLIIPRGKINIEVDGIQHLTDPKQIVADLNRTYHSQKNGYSTMHIPNEMIRLHLNEIADALAEAAKLRQQKIYVRVA